MDVQVYTTVACWVSLGCIGSITLPSFWGSHMSFLRWFFPMVPRSLTLAVWRTSKYIHVLVNLERKKCINMLRFRYPAKHHTGLWVLITGIIQIPLHSPRDRLWVPRQGWLIGVEGGENKKPMEVKPDNHLRNAKSQNLHRRSLAIDGSVADRGKVMPRSCENLHRSCNRSLS